MNLRFYTGTAEPGFIDLLTRYPVDCQEAGINPAWITIIKLMEEKILKWQ